MTPCRIVLNSDTLIRQFQKIIIKYLLTAADQLTLVALELLIRSGKSPFPRHWCGDILKEIIDSLSVTLIEITGDSAKKVGKRIYLIFF